MHQILCMHMEIAVAEVEPLQPKFAKPDNAARYADIGRSTVCQAIKSGDVLSYKLGPGRGRKSTRLVDLDSLDRWIRNGGRK